MKYRPSFIWSTVKLVAVIPIAILLLLRDNTLSCSWTGSTQHGYYACSASCTFDGNIACRQNGTSTYEAPTTCTSTHSSSYNEYLGNYTYTCNATVDGACYTYGYWAVLLIYVFQWLVHLGLLTLCDDFDPQQQTVDIALKYDFNSETITTLFHPANSLLAIIDCCAQVLGMLSLDANGSYTSCDGGYSLPLGTLPAMLCLMVYAVEWYQPIAINTMRKFQEETTDIGPIVLSLFKIDLMLTCNFLRAMQAFTSPVSILSYISVQKQERAVVGSKWLNMDVRESFTMYAMSGSGHGGDSGENKWALMAVIRKLCSRYTVQYSFLKLLASIIVSLSLNEDYKYCGAPDRWLTASQCPSDCRAHCIFASKEGYEYYPKHSHLCGDTTYSCYCDNWVMTDMLAMFFNSLHFILQCYYLIHYNNFDPQQNQIDCVQSYTFVGNNITLFLTHPAICFLSVLEASVLIVSWIAVIYQLGVVCSGEQTQLTSGLTFALLMTIIEVYKANMTVATREWREKRYGWAAFSLLRADLFVFYGSTLFLQTFLFPLSLVGYCTQQVRKRLGFISKNDDGNATSTTFNDDKTSCEDGSVEGGGDIMVVKPFGGRNDRDRDRDDDCGGSKVRESLLDGYITSGNEM